MPKMNTATNLYEQFERICPALKAQGRNLPAAAVAAAIVNAVLEDAKDAIAAKGLSIEGLEFLTGNEGKATRAKIQAEITPCITASKNYQNSYLAPSGLLPKIEAGDKQENEEFI